MTTIEPSRRERKKEETRHRIFHAAIDLFRERGFEQTTVDEITERADVAKGTFFNYFPRKDAVLGFLSENRLLAVEENAEAIFGEDRPVREKLLDVYSRAASAYEEDRDLSRYVLLEVMSRAFAPHEDSARRWHELICRLLAQGQQRGELLSDLALDRAESILTCVYYGTLYEWVCCTPEPWEVVAELRGRLALALEGIAS
jgi:TetR/AcrR family transcriptional regulator, cholesterol catabolism regulator